MRISDWSSDVCSSDLPLRRVEAIRALAQAGIPVVASISPIIPAITDHEIEDIVACVASAGALDASYIPVRLPHEVAPLFRAWLEEHYPDRATKVMAIIRDIRGGRDTDPDFGRTEERRVGKEYVGTGR